MKSGDLERRTRRRKVGSDIGIFLFFSVCEFFRGSVESAGDDDEVEDGDCRVKMVIDELI